MDPRHAIEHFHLQFLRILCAGPDKGDFALKGGCNLRFFFGSVRYSEDLDIDVDRVPVRTLKGRVDKLLEGPALGLTLRAHGLRIASVSAPNQTETTQRWKITLELPGQAQPRNTKVEFSRRPSGDEARVEPIEAGFAQDHQLLPIVLPHYPLQVAVRQKVRALAGRALVQARDVFDLSVLFARSPNATDALEPTTDRVAEAIERAMELSFDDYAGQVVSYLPEPFASELGSRASWEALQARVVDHLERAAGAS